MSKNEKNLLEIVEKNEKALLEVSEEEKNTENKEIKNKDKEKFIVVKIVNDKAIMVRSQKTGKLFARKNNKNYITQIIE